WRARPDVGARTRRRHADESGLTGRLPAAYRPYGRDGRTARRSGGRTGPRDRAAPVAGPP
ncbi:hypothetical protein, partial [Actinomadura sp. CNU-125]|uniref:hypothetical protein n=1 Tax=Actinomadura sp. CNU-125 TaxID=1904961 RepID=UPI0021CC5678